MRVCCIYLHHQGPKYTYHAPLHIRTKSMLCRARTVVSITRYWNDGERERGLTYVRYICEMLPLTGCAVRTPFAFTFTFTFTFTSTGSQNPNLIRNLSVLLILFPVTSQSPSFRFVLQLQLQLSRCTRGNRKEGYENTLVARYPPELEPEPEPATRMYVRTCTVCV